VANTCSVYARIVSMPVTLLDHPLFVEVCRMLFVEYHLHYLQVHDLGGISLQKYVSVVRSLHTVSGLGSSTTHIGFWFQP
jgi:hypothetical protein